MLHVLLCVKMPIFKEPEARFLKEYLITDQSLRKYGLVWQTTEFSSEWRIEKKQ